MRKYYKLVLVTVTAISLFCLIFYKTQYDKLYNVLEVLEFFGKEPNSAKGPLCQNAFHTGLSTFRAPAFQRINDGVFAYSAFCFREPDGGGDECPLVMVIASVVLAALKDFRCKLWYDGSIQPLEGVFSSSDTSAASSSSNNGSFRSHQFFCQSKFSTKVPFAVELVSKTGSASVHVHSPPGGLGTRPLGGSVGVCITPPDFKEDSTYAALESILLNSHFGIQNFILYDRGFSSKFFSQLDRAKMNTNQDLNVRVVPWNPPFPMEHSQAHWIVDTDCFYRTRHTVETVLVLGVDQVVVPRAATTVQGVLSRTGHARSGLFRLNILKFCSELPSEPASDANTYTMRALEQSMHDLSAKGDKNVIRKGAEDMETVISVESDVMTVNDYSACGTFDFDDSKTARDTFVTNMARVLQDEMGAYFPLKSV
jgi:hypothetical protein